MFKKKSGTGGEYRQQLEKERDEKRRIVQDCVSRLPALTAARETAQANCKAHIDANRHRSGMVRTDEPFNIESRRLQELNQVAYDALSACEAQLRIAEPRLKELERLLDADAEAERSSELLATAVGSAQVAQRKVQLANDMITAIDAEKDGRAERRKKVADANAAAAIEHAELALAARGDGKPVPPAPEIKRLKASEESDADLDGQRDAAVRMRDKHSGELAGHIAEIEKARTTLIRVRLDAADLRMRAAVASIEEDVIEYEAARRAAGRWSDPVELRCDELKVQARANAMAQELPSFVPTKAPVAQSASNTVMKEAAA